METIARVAALRERVREARRQGQRVGFVPTMGFLHDGHLSLMRAARAANDLVIASIFVNPTQFAPHEDLDQYPRDAEGDALKCAENGVQVLFTPTPEEMYPSPTATWVSVDALTRHLCAQTRPTHFRGVATVVTKLFNMVQPDAAYFGEKDYQQLAVIRRMVLDLNMPVEVVGCPTGREPDGVAMSSRNAYLTSEAREQAPSLYRSLQAARAAFAAGERDAGTLRMQARQTIGAQSALEVDYVDVVDPDSLVSFEQRVGERAVMAVAAFAGRARLIDNLRLDPGQ